MREPISLPSAPRRADERRDRLAGIDEPSPIVPANAGKRVDVSFRDLIDKGHGQTHAAGRSASQLHLSQSRDGELFITSRQHGMTRMLVSDSR